MGLRIKTNTASVNAQRHLEKSTSAVQESMTKLASGSRINKSADDAAGLAVSENLRADLRSLAVAKRNANDGISLIQVAEGGLEETNNMLIRLRELAIQSASDTISDKERAYLDQEFVQLKDEINRIAGSTEFNGTRLLVGESDLPEDMKGLANPFPLEIQVNKDYFVDSDGLDKTNPVNVIRIDLSNLNAFTFGENSLDLGNHEEGSRVMDKVSAQHSISAIDSAITRVSEHRAYLGAVQNRMGSTINNLGLQIQSLTESRSRISDTDYAVETANFTKENILQQAGTSILASANSLPKVALSLLQG
ncbi:MAG: flagellin FliC [Deltaproteobacteria bacterium]|nr:flagellin FliC [Deltaproteobacteria bacterium]